MVNWQFNTHSGLSCDVLLFLSDMAFQRFSLLWNLYNSASIYPGYFTAQSSGGAFLTLWALLCHTARVLFWHPQGLIAPFAFYSSFDTLWVFLLTMLSSLLQMKAGITPPSRERKRNNFQIVSAACKSVLAFKTWRPTHHTALKNKQEEV